MCLTKSDFFVFIREGTQKAAFCKGMFREFLVKSIFALKYIKQKKSLLVWETNITTVIFDGQFYFIIKFTI